MGLQIRLNAKPDATLRDPLSDLSQLIDSLSPFELITDNFISYYEQILKRFSESPVTPRLKAAYVQKTAGATKTVLKDQGLLAELAEAIAENSIPLTKCAELGRTFYRSGTPLHDFAESLAGGKPVDYEAAKLPVIEWRLQQEDQKYDVLMNLVVEKDDAPEVIRKKEERRSTSMEDRAYQLGLVREKLDAEDARELVLKGVLDAYISISQRYSLILEESGLSISDFAKRIMDTYEKSNTIPII